MPIRNSIPMPPLLTPMHSVAALHTHGPGSGGSTKWPRCRTEKALREAICGRGRGRGKGRGMARGDRDVDKDIGNSPQPQCSSLPPPMQQPATQSEFDNGKRCHRHKGQPLQAPLKPTTTPPYTQVNPLCTIQSHCHGNAKRPPVSTPPPHPPKQSSNPPRKPTTEPSGPRIRGDA